MYAETYSVEQRQLNVRPSTIKLHADGNITSRLITGLLLKLLHVLIVRPSSGISSLLNNK
jgi:hypothetical protein